MLDTSTPFHHAPADEQLEALKAVVRRLTCDVTPVRVLEAGCGEYPSPIGLEEAESSIVGIDVSQRQLDRNGWADEKIHADLETYDLPAAQFDVVVTWDVLEHLAMPERVLIKLSDAVRPGGVLVVKVPNVLSAKGLITKLTPYRFHVWVYKHVFGYPNPGKDDRPPFRTFLKRAIAPGGLLRFAKERGLSVEMFAAYEADKQANVRARYRVTGRLWRVLRGMMKTLSLGRIDPEATELIAVFRKA